MEAVTHERKPRIVPFAIMVTLFWMSLYTYQPQLSPHSYALGASTVLVGTILSSYGFTQMFLRIPIGLASDRLGKRKPFVIMGCAISFAAALGMGFANNPIALLIFRGLSGAAASAWVSFTVLFSSYYDPAKAPQAMARVMIFNELGRMTSMILGGQATSLFGDRAAFFLSAAFGVLSIAAALFITETAIEKRTSEKFTEQLKVGLDKTLLVASGLALLVQIIQWGATNGFTPQFAVKLGGTPAQLGFLTAFSELGILTASILNTKILIDKWGTRRCIITGAIVNATFTAIIPLFARSIPVLFALQFGAGLGNGLCFPLLMGISIQDISREKRGVAMGFYQSIYALGMFIGPILTSFLASIFSLPISLFCIGCSGFITAIIAAFALPRLAKG
jgi:MFS family permease